MSDMNLLSSLLAQPVPVSDAQFLAQLLAEPIQSIQQSLFQGLMLAMIAILTFLCTLLTSWRARLEAAVTPVRVTPVAAPSESRPLWLPDYESMPVTQWADATTMWLSTTRDRLFEIAKGDPRLETGALDAIRQVYKNEGLRERVATSLAHKVVREAVRQATVPANR